MRERATPATFHEQRVRQFAYVLTRKRDVDLMLYLNDQDPEITDAVWTPPRPCSMEEILPLDPHLVRGIHHVALSLYQDLSATELKPRVEAILNHHRETLTIQRSLYERKTEK